MQQKYKIDWADVKASVEARKKDRVKEQDYGPLFRIAAMRPIFTVEEIMKATESLSQKFEKEDLEKELQELLNQSEVVPNLNNSRQRRLSDALRQKVMSNCGSLQLAKAYLPSDAEQSTDVQQKMLALYMSGKAPALDQQNLTELNATASIAFWLSGYTSEGIPRSTDVVAALKRQELLAPFQMITAYFRGRTKELAQLHAFVEQPDQTSAHTQARYDKSALHSFAMMVFGIGGSGKTTLVAQFILEQLKKNGNGKFGFAYFDFDRPDMRPEPMLLLDEMVRQMQQQYPADMDVLQGMREDWKPALNTISRGYDRDFYLDMFGNWWKNRGAFPLLLVFDSFEEIQNWMHPSDRENLLRYLADLKRNIPWLRVVISGRANVDYFDMQPLALGDFDKDSALSYLRARGVEDEKCALEIWKYVKGNPLDLKMAAIEAKKTGCKNISELLGKIDEKRMREVLFHRQLEHIHDEEVCKLAVPGLVVRVVNEEVIREVLAGPCELGVITPEEAKKLMDKLQQEAFLVEREAGNWRFRPDLRNQLIDLSALKNSHLTRKVHDAAVAYYAAKPDPASQAEYIYHRLKRGDAPESLGKIDFEAVKPFLRTALDSEDLPPAAYVFLAKGFGRELSGDLRQRIVELPDWEKSMASTILSSFATAEEDFLKRLADDLEKRPDRSPNSALQLAEIRLYERLNMLDKAESLAQTAIRDARKAFDAEKELQARLDLLDLSDRRQAYEEIVKWSDETILAASTASRPLPACRAALVKMRSCARLGSLTEDLADGLLSELQKMDFAGIDNEAANAMLRDLLPENFFSRQLQKGPITKSATQQRSTADHTPFSFRRFSAAILERLMTNWSTAEEFHKKLDELRENASNSEKLETCSRVRLNRPLHEICDPGVWEICSYDLALFAEKEGQMELLLYKERTAPETEPGTQVTPPNNANIAPPTAPLPRFPERAYSVSTLLKELSAGSSGNVASEVRDLVAKAKTEEAINILLDFTGKNPYEAEMQNEVIQLSSRYKSLTRQARLGLLAHSEVSIQTNQIVAALLEVVSNISEKTESKVASSQLDELYLTDPEVFKKFTDGGNLQAIAWLEQALQWSQATGLCIRRSSPDSVVCWIQDEPLTNGIKALSVNGGHVDVPIQMYEFNYREFKGEWVAGKQYESALPSVLVEYENLKLMLTGFSSDQKPGQAFSLAKDKMPHKGEEVFVLSVLEKKTILVAGRVMNDGHSFDVVPDAPVTFLPGSPVLNKSWQLLGIIYNDMRAVSAGNIAFLFTPREDISETQEVNTAPPTQPANLNAKRFVVLYDEEDEADAGKMNTHLIPLKRTGKMTAHFLFRDAMAGEDPWRRAEDELRNADYVICLVTSSFMANDKVLDFALKSGRPVIPVLIDFATMEGSGLDRLKSLPTRGRTISDFKNEAEAYIDVITELRKLL